MSTTTNEPIANKKLLAIRAAKNDVTKWQTSLEDWTTPNQSVPSSLDPSGSNPLIVVGGGTSDSLAEGLTSSIWDSPAATECSTTISSAVTSASSAMQAIIDSLTAAEQAQVYAPGLDPEPDSPEANWSPMGDSGAGMCTPEH